MASSLRIAEFYMEWKKAGLKRKLSKELANKAGVSLQTLYKWYHKPITINGIKYENWEEAYQAETREIRENFRKEIDAQLEEDYRLSDILANEILMKYIIKVKDEDYKPSLDELKLAVGIQDKKRESASENTSKDNIKSVGFTIGFRGDKVGDT